MGIPRGFLDLLQADLERAEASVPGLEAVWVPERVVELGLEKAVESEAAYFASGAA